MALHNSWKLLLLVWLCSSCYAQLSSGELRQVEYKVDNEKNDVDIVKDEASTEYEALQNIPKENDIEEPFKKATKPLYCLGCVINVPIEQPGVTEMAERAVSAMDQIIAAPTIHASPRVLGVQKQVVNGIQYYLQIEVFLSDCPPSTSSPRNQCNPLPDSPSMICEVIFLLQPWVDPKPQLISNNCTDANSDNDIENYTPDDLLAVERSSGVENSHPMFQDEETQTSIGQKQDATTLAVEDTSNDEDRNGREVNSGIGTMKPMDSSEMDLINELADIAVHTLNELEVGDSHKQVIDVVDAKKQIVNGLMYHLVLRIGSKFCSDETAECQKLEWITQSICNVKLHRSWAEDTPYKAKVVSSECEEAWDEGRGARNLPDDWVLQDIYDPEYTDCIKKVLSKAYNIVPQDIVMLSGLMRQDLTPRLTHMIAELKLDNERWTISNPSKKAILVLRPKVLCYREAERPSEKVAKVSDTTNPRDNPSVEEVMLYRTKRSLEAERPTVFGGVNAADKNDAGVQEASTFAVNELSKREGTNSKLLLLEIVDAKQQVVQGISYHLTLKVSESNCNKDSSAANCQALSDGKRELCSLKVWSRPWLNEMSIHDVDCKPERTKRATDNVPGGLSDADENSPEVKAAVDCAEEELNKRSNDGYQKKVVEVMDAKQQVVAGMLYHLKLKVADCQKADGSATCERVPNTVDEVCSVQVWSRPWLNATEVTDVSCSPLRSKRSVENVPGGLSDADENSPEVKAAVDYAEEELNKRSNDGYQKKVVEVMDAKQQVVAGMLYHLKLKVADCQKADGSATCERVPNTVDEVCSVQVWSRPWLNSMEVTDVSCSPLRSKRSVQNVPGGLSDADENSPEVKAAVDYAEEELNKRSNDGYQKKVVEVMDAKQQVVAGMLYHLKLKVADCQKADGSATCERVPNTVDEVCSVQVWSRPWLNSMEVTDVSCSPLRSKRSVQNVGGEWPADRNSDSVKAASDFAVEQWEQSINSAFKHRVVEVLEARKQLVSGMSYQLKLKVEATNCKKGDSAAQNCERTPTEPIHTCTAKVLSKPWLKKMTLRSMDCTPGIQESQIGGFEDVKLEDPNLHPEYVRYIQDIAEYSRGEIDKATNSIYTQKVLRIIEAKKQVVSGVLIHLKLELARTGCMKMDKDQSRCQALPNQKSQICEVKVWDRPWLKVRKIKDLKCEDAQIISSAEPPLDASENLFNNFIIQFNKSYNSELERKSRFEIFKENLNTIKELQDTEQGTATYGPTMFADLTHDEFKHYLGLRPDLAQENAIPFPQAKIPNVQLPKEFDWRDHSAVTPVKNQGLCGSCWAFAVTGNVEGQYAIKYKKLLSFSEQELVDCDKLDSGCQGGLPDNAYRALEQLGGLELEGDYPYDGRGESCSFNRSLTHVRIHGAVNITSNETDMAKWLLQNGPIAIGINANAMQFYMGGVSHPLKFLCRPSSLDHGVLIVGFGEHRTRYRKKMLPYWLIKNSWGKFWGEQGYYRIYRGDGSCGVNMMASSAIIE